VNVARAGRVGLLGLILTIAGACSPPAATSAASPGATELTVYAAASLAAVLGEVKKAYEGANPGIRLILSTDSSSALATKIEQGAPADVFLSADTTNPDKLVAAGLAAGAPAIFASNRLTVIVPSANPAAIHSPSDLARPGVKIIAAGDGVPITSYANQLIQNLAASPGYPAGFAKAYAANVVSREDNVAAVVTKVALAEGDAAVVYATDARGSASRVVEVPVPDAANVIARYAGVVIRASPRVVAAAGFLGWLAGPAGQAVLRLAGFLPPA